MVDWICPTGYWPSHDLIHKEIFSSFKIKFGELAVQEFIQHLQESEHGFDCLYYSKPILHNPEHLILKYPLLQAESMCVIKSGPFNMLSLFDKEGTKLPRRPTCFHFMSLVRLGHMPILRQIIAKREME